MAQLDALGIFLSDLPVYFANGVLIIVYALAGSAPALTCMAATLGMVLLPDVEAQRRAAFQPNHAIPGRFPSGASRRGEAAFPQPRTAQGMTLLALLFWLAAQAGMGAPVPWIGAVMWLAGLLAILALPGQQFNLLWFVKAGIVLYALVAVTGSRIYLASTASLTAAEWAGLVGSSGDAAALVAGTRGSMTAVILWALWLIVPLGYFSMLAQQLFANPMSIANPFATAQGMLRRLRTRDLG